MFRTQPTQREWLLEDLEQIQRYFPGAELLETLETPFDIKTLPFVELETSSYRRVAQRTKSKLPMRSVGASEKRAGECGLSASEVMLIPEEGQAPFESMRVFVRGAFL